MTPSTLLLLAAVAFGACTCYRVPGQGSSHEADMLAVWHFNMAVENWEQQQEPNIPELVKQLGLTELYKLVGEAKLVDVLSSQGPFTVFGPTNKAFTELPPFAKKLVSNLTVLAEVLKYHVLPGKVASTDLKNDLQVKTVQGQPLRINIYKENSVFTAQCSPIDLKHVDQKASNGLIHVLEKVMLPPYGNIVASLASCPSFKTLVTAVKAANLAETLSGAGPFTVFAPTDKAFSKLPPGALDKLLKNTTALTEVLLYHVVSGTACSAGLSSGSVTTLAKKDVDVVVSGAHVTVNGIQVIAADASVTNGVVHAIDEVLLPKEFYLANNVDLPFRLWE